jgi:hypothetical protein
MCFSLVQRGCGCDCQSRFVGSGLKKEGVNLENENGTEHRSDVLQVFSSPTDPIPVCLLS